MVPGWTSLESLRLTQVAIAASSHMTFEVGRKDARGSKEEREGRDQGPELDKIKHILSLLCNVHDVPAPQILLLKFTWALE